MNDFKTTIGLEIHVQLATKSKMFCRCDNNSEESKPNINVCPRCLGMPGTLPVANRQAIEWTIKTGLALNCDIPKESKFDRKHYFYPDLPKGYQISQYDQPLCKGGWLEIKIKNQESKIKNIEGDINYNQIKRIQLNRIHLEEDAGKLVHKNGESLVDLNRASTPLMEIVTEPCIKSAAEARAFLQELQLLIRYLKVSEASMEKGHLRCDANISIQKIKDQRSKVEDSEENTNLESSEIVEIKNLNSFKFVEKALLYEEERLRGEYGNWPAKSCKVTRGFDSDKGVTYAQRQKEEASDYRYFPEPDVPMIKVKSKKLKAKSTGINNVTQKAKSGELEFDVEEIRKSIGHLPHILRVTLSNSGIPDHVSEKIVANPRHAWYLMSGDNLEKNLALWVTEEVNAQIATHKITYEEYQNRVPISHLADLLALVKAGKISVTVAKEVFTEMVKTGQRAYEIVEQKGLEQMSDDDEIVKIVSQILNDNPNETSRLKAGDNKLTGFFVGLVMKESKGKANPKIVQKVLQDLILK